MRANDTQVGGDHYQQPEGVPQHWDLSAMYQWDGFQHCITKYVMRWKTKHSDPHKKLEDLKKALHFLQKYIEVHERLLPKEGSVEDPLGKLLATKPELAEAVRLSAFETANPRFTSDNNFLTEGGWGNGKNLYTCMKCREKVVATGLEEALKSHWNGCTGRTPTPPVG